MLVINTMLVGMVLNVYFLNLRVLFQSMQLCGFLPLFCNRISMEKTGMVNSISKFL